MPEKTRATEQAHEQTPEQETLSPEAASAQRQLSYGGDGLSPNQRAVLRMQQTQGNAVVQRHLAGVVQREIAPLPTSAMGLILNIQRANIVNNWFQVQVNTGMENVGLWNQTGFSNELASILSGPGYWQGHRTWAPREAVVDLGLSGDNIGVTIRVELMEDNATPLGSGGRVGIQSTSGGEFESARTTESAQTSSAEAAIGQENRGSVTVGTESSNTHGASGGTTLSGSQQGATNSRNSTRVSSDLWAHLSVVMRRFNRFGSEPIGTFSNNIAIGTAEYVNPTYHRHVAIPGQVRILNSRPSRR